MGERQEYNSASFFERPGVMVETIPVAGGIPFGIESVSSAALGMGGVYGAWGRSYDNKELTGLVSERLGEALADDEILNLSELGFVSRHHIPDLTDAENLELELQVGARLLRQAAAANGWEAAEVDGVLIGLSAPAADDYVEQIARRAGIRDNALKVSVHKACDGSVGALHLALNPGLAEQSPVNVAEALAGRKVLVGAIEGLSHFTARSRDRNALQLFANGAGVMGVIPGVNMKLVTGRTLEKFDEEGLLQMRMLYPHSRQRTAGGSLLEVTQESASHLRIAGMLYEPLDGTPARMAGMLGMVKLFVRTGVEVLAGVYHDYAALMGGLGQEMHIEVGAVHHANFKINQLMGKQLRKEGVQFPMPWVLSDFGNVSAASCMIAFLRQLERLKPGDHVLFNGYGAGTYYDVLVVEI